MDEALVELRDSLAAFDLIDLAGGLGGLQLLPVNAERQLRLERAVALVYGVPHEEERPSMSAGRWRTVLNEPPVATARVLSDEDPPEDVFTSSVSFVGGSHVVCRGIIEDSPEVLRLLLEAIFLMANDLPPAYVDEMRSLAYAVLRLSDAVAYRAGLPRHVLPGRDPDGRVVVPPAEEVAALKAAVTFSRDELREVLDPVPAETLDPLLEGFGTTELNPDEETDVALLYVRPLLRHGDTVVVAMPSGLLVALRHRMITRAYELGLEDELASRYRTAAAARTGHSLRWMGWAEEPWGMNDAPPWADEGFWRFDVDKLAHVVVLADDLAHYAATDPFGRWTPGFAAELEQRLVEASDRLLASIPGLVVVLHLVVLQGVGRYLVFGFGGADLGEASEVMIISQSDLAALGRFEARDPLALWKFARARSRLRKSTAVMAFSVLDEYGAYRGARHSFYLADDRVPDAMTIATDYGADLRFEDTQRFDVHGVPRWDGAGIMDVQRRWEGTDVPIYAPDPLRMRRVEFLLEGQAVPVWVYQGMPEVEDPGIASLYFELCDMVVYWLWQAAESLEPVLGGLAEVCNTLQIIVLMSEAERWGDREQMDGQDWLKVSSPEIGVLELRFTPAAQRALGGADNRGEREMLATLLEGLTVMAAEAGGPPVELDIPTAVDRHAPLGVKKKLMVLDTSVNLTLLPGRLPPARTIQEADVELLLDQSGPEVSERLALSEGPLPDTRRNEVLNTVVELHFQELEATIAGLDPNGVLERLVMHHEAVVRAYYEQRLNLPTSQACFGSESAFLDEGQERLDELMRADQALRFLIEYATACPPSGELPLSLSTLDHLTALAHEIIGKGMLSDAVYAGFGDLKMSVLPSGRLGFDREGRYILGVESFRAVRARHDVQAAHDYFGEHWREGSAPERPDSIDALDEATRAEFGLSMTEIAHLLGELLNLGTKIETEPKVMPLPKLVETLMERLGWTKEHVEHGIEIFSLRPRDAFFPENSAADAWPWRFNRDLSYVRRPLLIREAPNDPEDLIWGIRHLNRVGPNLLHLIQGGRLNAQSTDLRTYMGTMRHQEGEAFNDLVAEAFESRPGLIVRRRVKKVGPLRIERRRGEPLGDVDVLVVDPGRRRIQAVETKNFELARTPAELRHELAELLQGDGSAASLHTERIEWLRSHVPAILDWLGIDDPANRWRVEGLIVTSRDLLGPHVADSPFDVSSLDQLRGEG